MHSRIEKITHNLTILGFFLIPWQTIWIYRHVEVHGHIWQYATLGFYLSELVLWTALALWLFKTYKQKKFSIQKINHIGPIAFTALILLTLKQTGDVWVTIQGLSWMILAWWAAMVVIHARQSKTYLTSLAVSLVCVAIVGIIQFIDQSIQAAPLLGIAAQHPETLGVPVVVAQGQRLLRAFGSFPHPNIFGGYMVLGIVISLTFLQSQKTRIGRALYITSFAGLLMSFSRSAWIAVALVFAIHFYQKKWKTIKKISSLTFGILAIFILLYHPYILNRIQPTEHIEQQSITQRVDGYETALSIFKTSPIFGVGVHNYTHALYESDNALPGYALQPVHNVPLLMLVEWGVVGVLVIVFGTIYLIRKKQAYKTAIITLVILAPILLLDHYLWSLYSGILLVGLFVALNVQTPEHKR